MNQDEYGLMVGELMKKGDIIKSQVTGKQLELMHMAVGVAGEAGELLDAIKKHVFYQKPIDIENVIEELGDLEFYMEGIRRILLLTRAQTLTANHTKLTKKRYKAGYSDAAAIAREDKIEPKVELDTKLSEDSTDTVAVANADYQTLLAQFNQDGASPRKRGVIFQELVGRGIQLEIVKDIANMKDILVAKHRPM